MPFLRRVPLPMSALALGLASLGNLLANYSAALRIACGAASALVLLLVVARAIVDFGAVRTELETPAALSVAPTFFMALMLLTTYIAPFSAGLARGVWLAALAGQLLVVAVFLVRFVGTFRLAQVLPSWFLIFVGFVVGAVTSPVFAMQPVGRALLYAGLVGYAGILPVIVYRLVKGGELPKPAAPTIAIFAAPPNLCLVGYLAVADVKQAWVVYLLLAIGLVNIAFVLTRLPRILRGGFLPSFGALTFPFVISAIAFRQANALLASTAAGALVPSAAVVAVDLLAATMVLYVLARYVVFLAVAPAKEPQAVPAPVTP